jgi:hypothetical protein
VPRIENSVVSANRPITTRRLGIWRRAGISVRARPDWVFIKLHCHGMDARDLDQMLGAGRVASLEALRAFAGETGDALHFVTAREMVNIALAACDGRDGSPNDFRDYRLTLLRAA